MSPLWNVPGRRWTGWKPTSDDPGVWVLVRGGRGTTTRLRPRGISEAPFKLDWRKGPARDPVRRGLSWTGTVSEAADVRARHRQNGRTRSSLYGGNNNWFAALRLLVNFRLYGPPGRQAPRWAAAKKVGARNPARWSTAVPGAGRGTSLPGPRRQDSSAAARCAARRGPSPRIGKAENLVDVQVAGTSFTGKLLAPAHLPQEAGSACRAQSRTAKNIPWSQSRQRRRNIQNR